MNLQTWLCARRNKWSGEQSGEKQDSDFGTFGPVETELRRVCLLRSIVCKFTASVFLGVLFHGNFTMRSISLSGSGSFIGSCTVPFEVL